MIEARFNYGPVYFGTDEYYVPGKVTLILYRNFAWTSNHQCSRQEVFTLVDKEDANFGDGACHKYDVIGHYDSKDEAREAANVYAATQLSPREQLAMLDGFDRESKLAAIGV